MIKAVASESLVNIELKCDIDIVSSDNEVASNIDVVVPVVDGPVASIAVVPVSVPVLVDTAEIISDALDGAAEIDAVEVGVADVNISEQFGIYKHDFSFGRKDPVKYMQQLVFQTQSEQAPHKINII